MILPGTGRGTGEAGGGGVRQMPRPEVALARKLRRTMTLLEVMLWQHLRGSPDGMRFRRQHPIGCYVADFFLRQGAPDRRSRRRHTWRRGTAYSRHGA
ncbi:endonuclease domain-containing protein [Sphingomonas yabuuchiae]|uniref:endonuclease domain-containing protein n=1 Tax=Sphingomonas yabuuchiae TaxID=172044 RepID=UPI00360B4058